MNTSSNKLENVDVLLITIIPETELRALQVNFNIDPTSDPDTTIEEVYIWFSEMENEHHGPLSIAIACLPDKGVLSAQNKTQALLGPTSALSPDLVLLVGTAGGLDGSANGDLVISTEGVVYYEPESDDIRPKWIYPSQAIQSELKINFDESQVQYLGLTDQYTRTIDRLEQSESEIEIPEDALFDAPDLNYKAIASGEKILDDNSLNDISEGKGQVEAAEMEGFGVAKVCENEGCHWMIIRSISDRGNRETRKEYAPAAAAMAAAYANIYVNNAKEPFESSEETPKVEPDSLYSRKKIPDLMNEYLNEEYDIDISDVDFDLKLTIEDLEEICVVSNSELTASQTREALREARSYAYEEKYGQRSTDEDERFTVMGFENWKREFRDTLNDVGISTMQGDDVLIVGVGSGQEIRALYSGTNSITGIDVSTKMLDQTQDQHPEVTTYQQNAEDLDDIGTKSKDIYISLRTYQSTLFDHKAAIFEAGRVLRPGGTIVLSVPYVFYNQERDEVVQGLLRSPESDKLNPDLPYEIAENIRQLLERFMFERVKIRTGDVEIYIYGKREK